MWGLNSGEMGLAYPITTLILCLVALVFRKLYPTAWLAGSKKANSAQGSEKPGVLSSSKVQNREHGEWTPVAFDYPDIAACVEDWREIKPIPYRPFRWGEYHVTMGIRSMPWDEWVELDQQFIDYHKIRVHRMQTRGKRVVQTLPENPGVVGSGHAAAVELVHELAEYLSRRYPAVYVVTRHAPASGSISWYGLGQIKGITVVPLGKTYDLDEEDPMTLSALLIQEDLAIMVEGTPLKLYQVKKYSWINGDGGTGTDGRYYFQAGAVCIAGTWRMEDKMGMALDEIHISGRVPQFESKLNLSMGRFFKRMGVDKPVVRNNYTFQVIPVEEKQDKVDPVELSWAGTLKGDEDLKESEGERWLRGIEENEESGANKAKVVGSEGSPGGLTVSPSTVWLRTERQTLRRLPRTGAIVFTIRVYQTSVEQLGKEAGVPGRMASAIRSWPEEVSRYKAKAAYEGILEYLDGCHCEEVKRGIDNQDVNYPY